MYSYKKIMILACNLLLYSMLACYVNYKIFFKFYIHS